MTSAIRILTSIKRPQGTEEAYRIVSMSEIIIRELMKSALIKHGSRHKMLELDKDCLFGSRL